jgi:hypothetical protein
MSHTQKKYLNKENNLHVKNYWYRDQDFPNMFS